MKVYEEYQNYIKTITDKFVNSLTYNSAQPIEEQNTPIYKRVNGEIQFDCVLNSNGTIFINDNGCPDEMDGVSKTPKDVVEAWMKIKNEQAIIWLKQNIITFDEWKNKNKEL